MIVEKCNNCKWYEADDYVCVNAESDHCADFVMPNEICMEWEQKEDET